jgi:hypothetical protein
MDEVTSPKAEQQEARRKASVERCGAVIERYYIEQGQETPLKAVRHLLESLHSSVRKIGEAFEHNVSAVEQTMGIPATLANAAAHMKMWTQVLAAERIRSRMDEDRGSLESEARMIERAKEHMARHIAEIGNTIFVDDMCEFLLGVHQERNIPRALAELHAQGIVLLWSAVEVLARDLFIFCLNTRADLTNRLLEDESAKRLFHLKGLDFDVLQQHGFNVSRSMGEILAQMHDLSNLTTMKTCFFALFQDATLRERMSDPNLWTLFQRRNLIVHRRGMIDQRYLDATGESLPVGTQIAIRSSDLERAFKIVCSVSERLIFTANEMLKKTTSNEDSVCENA